MSVSKAIPQDLVFSVEANAGITFANVVFDGSEITKSGGWFILRDESSAVTVGTGCTFKISGCGTEKYTQESNFSLCSGDGTLTYKSGVFSSLSPAIYGKGKINIEGGEIYSKSTVINASILAVTGGSLYGGYGDSDYIVKTSMLHVTGGEFHSLEKSNIIFADFDDAEISGGKYVGSKGMFRVGKNLFLLRGSYTSPIIYMKKDARLHLTQAENLAYTLQGDWDQYTLDKYFITHVAGGLKQLNFVSLPSMIEPYFNPNTYEVKLWKKQQNLQDWLDNLPPEGADTKEPVEYPIPSGGIDANGSGTIYNEGNLNLGGDGYTYNVIYNGGSGRIYILGKLNVIIRIHITITDIVLDTPIILGGDGYVLTEEDIKKIQIVLPNGYSWKYDSDLGGIVIISTTGIDTVASDNSTTVHYYDISGRKIGKMQKGINIVKSIDGKTRKVVVK